MPIAEITAAADQSVILDAATIQLRNRALERQLADVHLRAIDVGGAGNCFFLSVSFGLHGDEKHHAAVRASIAQFIRKQAEAAQPNDRAILLKRAADVSRDGFWPGEDVIVATAQCLQRPLHVYAAVGDSPLVYLPLSAPPKNVLPLKIAFMEPGHYNAVVSTLSTSTMTHHSSLRRSLSATQLNC